MGIVYFSTVISRNKKKSCNDGWKYVFRYIHFDNNKKIFWLGESELYSPI